MRSQANFSSAFTGLEADLVAIFQATKKPNVRDVTFGELRPLIAEKKVSFTEPQLLTKLNATKASWTTLQNDLTELNLAALPPLIDNQPQIVLKGSFREADDIVGPDTAAVTLSYEMGMKNLNAALREYRALRKESPELKAAAADPVRQREVEQSLRLQAFRAITSAEDLASEDRYSFSLTYKDSDPYDFSHDYTETISSPDTPEPLEVERSANLSLPGSTEWVGRFTWTRFLRSPKMRSTDIPQAETTADLSATKPPDEEKPRLSLTLERFETSGNPKLQDRTIGRLTLTLPAPGNMTLPISITYADNSEFLGEQDKTFGAHVGISYKINR
jgi:hypothetical protein